MAVSAPAIAFAMLARELLSVLVINKEHRNVCASAGNLSLQLSSLDLRSQERSNRIPSLAVFTSVCPEVRLLLQ